MKKSRRKTKNGQIKNAETSVSIEMHQDKNVFYDNDRLALMFPSYSLASSNLQASLNTISSLIIATDSAFAFTALAFKAENIFSGFILLYVISSILYLYIIFSNLKLKIELTKLINNKSYDIKTIFKKFEDCHKLNFWFAIIIFILSITMIIIYGELISKYIPQKL